MLVHLFTAALLLSSSVDKMAPYRGQPILSIDIDAPPDEDPTFLRQLIEIQPGFILAASDVQDAIKRLYALGRFANVRVFAQRLSGVVTLRFQLKPTQRLKSLSIRGVHRVDKENLLKALKLHSGDEVSSRTAQALKQRSEEFLDHAGFPRAEVVVAQKQRTNVREVDFVLQIREGPPRLVHRVEFTGQPRVTPFALHRIIATRAGDVLNRDIVALDKQRLRQAYLERGFLHVKVDDPLIINHERGQIVSFDINAGERIDVSFTGNTIATDQDLWALWPQREAGLGRRTLKIFADRIATHYRNLGYFNVAVTTRGFEDTGRQILRYVIHIQENKPIRVTQIDISGAQAITPTVLAEQIRAVLRSQLDPDSLILRLSPAQSKVARRGPVPYGDQERGPKSRSPIPPEARWIPELYDDALEDIGAIYRDRGYLNVRISRPQVTLTEDTAQVHIEIVEGIQTFLQSVRFTGNHAIASAELIGIVEKMTQQNDDGSSRIPVQLGQPFSASSVEDGRIALVRRYRDLGYLYARLFTEVELSEDKRQAHIVYRFEEGPQVRIRNVLIRGNHYTRERIIRSRITLKEDSLYRVEQALEDRRSIANLGTFSRVQVKLIDEERPAERKDLVAKVQERNRTSIDVAFGASTAEGPRAFLSYTHNNVLGTASTFSTSLKLNRQLFFRLYGEQEGTMRQRYDDYTGTEQFTKALERDIRVGFRSPRIKALPFDPALRLDLLNERENAIPFSLNTTAAIFGIDIYPSRRLTLAIEPQVSFSDLECPGNRNCGQDVTFQTDRVFEEGKRRTFAVGPTLVADFRDSPLSPTRGLFARASAAYAIGESRLPGETFKSFSFAKFEGSLIGYVPIFKSVLVLTAGAGTARLLEGKIPLDERFFLGGRDTLRGFTERTLIPEDACVLDSTETQPASCKETLAQQINNSTGELLPAVTQGGNTFVLFKTELRLPVTQTFWFDVFVDSGNLWVEDPSRDNFRLRVTTGFGIRYATPVGALALNLGFNPDPSSRRTKNAESIGPELHFSVSSF
ncbi:MAG: POTRA domain-containing protein [Myxococcota bacterium]